MSGDAAPRRLGKYEIEKVLARGAMGVVYLGRDPRIDRPVAVKTVRLDVIDGEPLRREFQERFLREARAAGRLNHPGIVTIYEADEDPETGLSYIAMEYVDGVTLKEYLQEHGAMPLGQAMTLMRQLLDALDYAHAHDTVHRDIKPANILLTERSGVKVTDFGIARFSASDMTQAGQILGTPGYMSPEQVQGRTVDGRSDLFSAAVVLYQALTRRKPFDADDFATTCYMIVHEDPAPPSELRGDLPSGVDAVLHKAMSKDPEDRYQTGAAFLSALREASGEGRSRAEPGRHAFSVAGSPERGKRRRLPLALAGAAVLAIAVAAAAWGLRAQWGAGEPVPEHGGPPVPEPPAVQAPLAPAPAPEREEPIPEPPVAPSGDEAGPGAADASLPEPAGEALAPRARTEAPSPAAATVPLRLDVYHRLPGGMLVVYIDHKKVKSQWFEGHTKLRKTHFDMLVEVPEGSHRIGVTVAPKGDWGKVVSGATTATFREGGRYALKVKVGSLGRDLDLEWD